MRRKIIKPAMAAALICVVAAALLSYLPLDVTRFAPRITARVESRFGYKLQMERVWVKLLPELDITIHGLTASGGVAQSLSAQTARVRVALLPLLVGNTVIRRVEADGVLLTASISKLRQLMKAEKGGTAPVIDNLELRGLKVRLINDMKTGARADESTLEADITQAYIRKEEDNFILSIGGKTTRGARFAASGHWKSAQGAVTGALTASGIDLEKLQSYLDIDIKKSGSFKGAADVNISYSIGATTGINGEISIRDAQARLPALSSPLRLNGSAAVTLNLDNGRYDATLSRVKLDAGDFKIAGAITAKGYANDMDFTVSASSTPVPLSTLKRLTAPIPMPSAIRARLTNIENETGAAAFDGINVSGSIRNGRLDTREFLDKLNLSIRLEKAGLSYPGLSASLKDISGRVTFKQMTISAEEIEARYGNISLQHLSAQVAGLASRPRYDISLKGIFDAKESARLVEELGQDAAWWTTKLVGTELAGNVSLSLNLKGEAGSAVPIEYSGTARLKDITASRPDMPFRLGPANANISFDNERITVNSMNAMLDDSSVELNGYVDDYASKTPHANISARASLTNEIIQRHLWSDAPSFSGRLDVMAQASGSLDEFSAAASVNTGAGTDDDKRTIRLSGAELTAKNARIRSGALSGIEAFDVKIKDAQVYGHIIKDLNATGAATKESVDGTLRLLVDDGEAFGGLTYYRGIDAPRIFDAAVTLNGVKLEEILTAFDVKNPILSGPVFGKSTLYMNRGDGRPVSRLNGSISLHADKGRLYKFLLLNKIFSIINIISIDELFKEGLPYKTIAGDFVITDGVLATEKLHLDSDSMRMSALGRIDMTARTIESFIAVRPFVTLDKIISSIPLAGWAVTDKDKSVVSLYYEVAGPLASPDVSPAAIKELKESVADILESLMTTEQK